MTANAPSIDLTPLHATGGQVFAYLVPADDFDKLQAELAQLRGQVARLQRQKDGYVSQLNEIYRTWIAPLPSEEELNGPVQNPNALDEIIARLEAH